MKGFSLLELMVVMGLIAILTALTVTNLIRPQTSASLDGVVNTLASDIKSQQLKAMVGDSLSATSAQEHGLRIQPTNYTLFKGASYSGGDTDNFTLQQGSDITLSTTLPSSVLIFTKAAGEVSGFVNGSNTITVTNSVSGQAKVLTINRYGAVSVN